ncbi:hypothetical protein CBR_g39318 [Chara braunii]|uniref:Uncharacterized protein n=1 Tax=Chara braunii TaxID=69332 RepID=A0A388K145_CHABU|nr:hypothetical protein CBR_g39318 [Chara braunii]|eukprot:GBG63774.1 hypothetical protein CBR_g39318 [Chara braunii]
MTGWGAPEAAPQGPGVSFGAPPTQQQMPTYGTLPSQQQQLPLGPSYQHQGPPGPSPVVAHQTSTGQQMIGSSTGPQQGFRPTGSPMQRPGPPPMMGAPLVGPRDFQRGPPPSSTASATLTPGPMGQMRPPSMRPMGGGDMVGLQHRQSTPQQHLTSGVGGELMGNGPPVPRSGTMGMGYPPGPPPPSGTAGLGPGFRGPPAPAGAGAALWSQPGDGPLRPPLPPSASSLPQSESMREGSAPATANSFFTSPSPMSPPGLTGPSGPQAMAVGPPPHGPRPSSSPLPYGLGDPQPGGRGGVSAPPMSRSLPPTNAAPPTSHPPYMSAYTPSPPQPPMMQMRQMSLGAPASASVPPVQSMGLPSQGSFAPMGPPSQPPTMMHPSIGAPGLGQQQHVYSDPYGSRMPGGARPLHGSLGVSNAQVAHGSVSSPPPPMSRIDPHSIPHPIEGESVDEVFQTRAGGMGTPPPPATSHFVAKDTGNCNPRFMRCTMSQIPVNDDLLTKSAMPLALMVQPLALPDPEEEQIQVVDFGESGPVRCARCKAYINPFMRFLDAGRRFQCNLCGNMNETPRSYFCNLGPDMRRRDADERPELCKGTVEFVATPEFMIRPPMSRTYFFLIDVSMTAVSSGMTACVCNAICRCLSGLPESSRTMIGIATFDATIHFYNLSPSLSQPAMLVVPDVDDVYAPQPLDLVVPLRRSFDHIVALLENIPSMFQNTRIADSSFGAAVQGAYLALKPTGGRLLVFQSVLPTIGVGALRGRESEAKSSSVATATGDKKETHKLLLPADPTFKKLATEFAEFQVSVDLFLTSLAYVDVASLSVLPKTTGGQVYYYSPFAAAVDSSKIYNDLRWNLTRPQGFEAVLRVRCSRGLSVQDYRGNFCKRIPTDVDLPSIDCDKSIMVTFKHDDKLQDGEEVCFQCGLLYTTAEGQRRIRVHTLSLPCTSALGNLFRCADLYTQFAYFLKQAAEQVPSTPLGTIRESIVNHCVNILHSYRKNCATSTAPAQLVLPEALKLLPLYTLALQKSVGLRSDVFVDERAYWLARVSSLSTALSIPLVYPRMFALHNLPSTGDANANGSSAGGILPLPVHLSSERLDHEGVFLLENGEDAYIWVGKGASTDLLYQLFGVRSVDEIMPPGQFVLQEYDNEHSKRLHEILNHIRRQRCSYLRLRVIRRGDPLENAFFWNLVEDKTPGNASYTEFLCHVHQQIQNKLAGSVN